MSAHKDKVLFLPASHEASPSQLALIVFLREIGYKPNTIVCSSGGAIAATLACAAEFERDINEFKDRLDSLCNYISTKLYLSKHKKIINIPFSISALLYPTIYNRGKDYKHNPFQFDIDRTQIIIGTKNTQTNLNTIWYTGGYPAVSHGDYELKKISDIREYIRVVRASSSIPGIVPPVKINGLKYHDSGMDNICPIECIIDKLRDECHLIFASPYDPENLYTQNTISENIQETLRDVMIYRKDSKLFSTFKILLNLFHGNVETNSGNTLHELIIALSNTDNCKKSLIVIFPNKTHKVNLFDTQNGDYTKAMERAYKDGFSFRQYMIF